MKIIRRLRDGKLEKRFNYLSDRIGCEIHWQELTEEAKGVVRLVGINNDLLSFAGIDVASYFNAPHGTSTKRYLVKAWFLNALPALSHIIHTRLQFEEVSNVLAVVARNTGAHADDVFQHGVPAVHDMVGTIEELRSLSTCIVEMTNAVKYHLDKLFGPALAAVRAVLRTPEGFRQSWPDVVELAKAAGPSASYVFQFGFPTVAQLIPTRAEFRNIGNDLVAMAKAQRGLEGEDRGHSETKEFFENGLPAVCGMFETREERQLYWSTLLQVTLAASPYAAKAFRHVLPALRHVFHTPAELKAVGVALEGMVGVPEVLEYGLPAVSHVIRTPKEVRDAAEELRKMAWEARGQYLLDRALPSVVHTFNTFDEFKNVTRILLEVRELTGAFRGSPLTVDLAGGLSASEIYYHGLPAVSRIIHSPDELREVIRAIIEMAKLARPQARNVVEHGLPAVQHSFQDLEQFKAVAKELSEIANGGGDDAERLLRHALPALRGSFRTPGEFTEVGRRLLEACRQLAVSTRQDRNKVVTILFWYGLPSVAKFIDTPAKLTEYWNLLLTIIEGWGPARANGIFQSRLEGALDKLRSPAEFTEYQKRLVRMVEQNKAYLTVLDPSEFPG